MGGPNLEVFKFSVYVFFPVVMLLYYGNPDWYAKNVLPVRSSNITSMAIPNAYALSSTRTESSHLNTGSSQYAFSPSELDRAQAEWTRRTSPAILQR